MTFTRKSTEAASSGFRTRPSPYNASGTSFDAIPPTASSTLQEDATKDVVPVKTEVEIEDIVAPAKGKGKAKVPSRKRKEIASISPSLSPRKSKVIRLALDIPHPEPNNWQEAYAAIKEMRKHGGAPVDEMGCHMAGGPVDDPKTKRFVTLVSLMLSSQTRDEVTHTAVANLRVALGELTVENVIAADSSVISGAIGKVGFWRRKTQYIKQASQKIQDEFCGEIPKTVDDLCSLPGVGPKMAFLALQVAWNINVGIGVDVHVHRITNRLAWHKPPTKEPEQTRLNLQSWLPPNFHGEINPLLVGFGQTICLPVAPKCDVCTLGTRGICPSARPDVKSKYRKAREKSSSLGPKVTVEVEANDMIAPMKTNVKVEKPDQEPIT